jgi:hypothetical protein
VPSPHTTIEVPVTGIISGIIAILLIVSLTWLALSSKDIPEVIPFGIASVMAFYFGAKRS